MNSERELIFKKSVYLLFRKYPLYLHQVSIPGEKDRLSVLLIGKGKYMDNILESVLTQGQLLDTELSITLLCPNAEEAKLKFIERAPEWKQFLTVDANVSIASGKETDMGKYAEIHFSSWKNPKNLKKEIKEYYSQYSYVIVSADDSAETYRIADACKSVSHGLRRIIAYKKDNSSNGFKVHLCSKWAEDFRVESIEKNTISKELERIAFNLHYSYAKQRNDHEPISSIRKGYDEYSRISSLCAAEHLLSKLSCCGINTPDNKTAAKDFQKKISQDSQLFDRLTDLEHRRWVVEKVLQGYRMPDENEIKKIFENGNTTRGEGENGKWHCCLVESRPDSRIKKEHWDMKLEELENSGLDGLDLMSVRIHQICGEKAGENRDNVEMNLIPMFRQKLLTAAWDSDIKDMLSQLELSISQLYQRKKSIIAVYHAQLEKLEAVLKENEKYKEALGVLAEIKNALVPQIEFISYTDYKDSDRQFIKMIPYVLTHDSNATIIKLVSNKSTDNIFSTWKMESRQTFYISFADSAMKLNRIRGQREIVSSCVDGIITVEKSIWKVFGSQRIMDSYIEYENNGWDRPGSIEIIRDSNQQLYNRMSEIVAESKGPCYLDTTGADQKQKQICEEIAKRLNIGIFYVDEDNRFKNLDNCEELEYPIPDKSITVKEMFNWNGAVEKPAHANRISDTSEIYKDMWEIACTVGTEIWNNFCKDLMRIRKDNREGPTVFKNSELHNPLKVDTESVISCNIFEILPLFELLTNEKAIIIYSLERGAGVDIATIKYRASESVKEKIESIINKLTGRNDAFLSIKREKETYEVVVNGLHIANMNLNKTIANGNRINYSSLLKQLKDKNAIDNKKMLLNEMVEFDCTSRTVLSILEKEGNVLEEYIYYTALLDGNFSDVVTSWKYNHAKDDNAAWNELDVICMKGNTALFISAKFVKNMDTNTLRDIIYEVDNQAMKFGLNAKSIIAIPSTKMFENNAICHHMQYCSSRGVYLLGDKCFEGDNLAKVLRNIADGKDEWYQFMMN